MLLVETLSPDQQPPNASNQNVPIDPKTGKPVAAEAPEQGNAENSGDEEYDGEGDDLEDGEDEGENEEYNGEYIQQEAPEIEPLKKYYLIQKITELRLQLQEHNIRNKDLDNVLKFVDNLSYNTLLSLVNAVLPDIEELLARLAANEKQKAKQEV